MTDHALDLLRQRPDLAELAAYPFNFDLDRADHVEAVRLASGGSLVPIAGDDTGGTFFVCGGGRVLYASSEGQAGLIGDSVTEALEVIIGLPSWHDCVSLTPADDPDGEQRIRDDLAELEEEVLEYVPELATFRADLRTGLGLPDRSPTELVARLYDALIRTEPEYLLLNAEELLAYEPLDRHPRPPLWQTVLGPGRADLALLRADPAAWEDVAGDDTRRAVVLRAAQYDRREEDLPFLRLLMKREADQAGMSDELRLAVVLVGLRGLPEDLPLLREVHETTYDTWCGLGGMPQDAAALGRWARDLDESEYGTDPADEGELTWIALAHSQGLTEHARAALIRMLDDTGPDAEILRALRSGHKPGPYSGADRPRLRTLSHELELIGDLAQAARAQRLYVSLQDTAWNRASEGCTLARLEREREALESAAAALRGVVTALGAGDPETALGSAAGSDAVQTALDIPIPKAGPDAAEDTSAEGWHNYGLGMSVVGEHFRLAIAAGEAGMPAHASAAYATGEQLFRRLTPAGRAGCAELAKEAEAAVTAVSASVPEAPGAAT
ncbi:hypothetical protein [Streptomyces sp. CBMA152]|uniref:hypothetical protein n=1 Tax=Streptomyces sp. CBMA152 TaxID=1896312 RepID=UPI0016602B41|nr:hypothetical protein [Streptomyces sp. CBMA152]MBD0747892.1 hypothetical protein [Streptomyces sp. CBMA152]